MSFQLARTLLILLASSSSCLLLDRCVEYLKLYTNRDRTLAIGNSQSSSPLLSTRPVATKGTFLAFFKGYTDVANTNARTGQLQQLQLVWAVRTCGGASQPPVSNPNPSAPPISNPNPSAPPTSNPNPSAPPTTDVSPPSSSPSPPVPSPPAAKCSPASKFGCNEGEPLMSHSVNGAEQIAECGKLSQTVHCHWMGCSHKTHTVCLHRVVLSQADVSLLMQYMP